jgi:hypothetical protein
MQPEEMFTGGEGAAMEKLHEKNRVPAAESDGKKK